LRGWPSSASASSGTFDPPHIGHLAAAVNVRHDLALDRVLCGEQPPVAEGGLPGDQPGADRLAMVQAAVGDVEGLEASSLEVEAGGPSYTADTLATLLAEEPDRSMS